MKPVKKLQKKSRKQIKIRSEMFYISRVTDGRPFLLYDGMKNDEFIRFALSLGVTERAIKKTDIASVSLNEHQKHIAIHRGAKEISPLKGQNLMVKLERLKY